MHKIGGFFKGNLSSLLHLSRAPTPLPIEMDSSSDNATRWATEFFSPTFHWNSSYLRISQPNVVPIVDVDDPLTTTFATEAYTLFSGPGAPISAAVPMSKQLESVSGGRLENPSTVSDHAALTIVITYYMSFSIRCLRSAVVHYRLLHLIPSCKQPRN